MIANGGAMLKIEFWIVRKGEDPWKMAPEVGDAISGHPQHGKCLFCRKIHEIVAVIAFCWREPHAALSTVGICQLCEAGHSDEELAEMVQQEVFADRVARLRSIEEACDDMEARGWIETIGVDPITGSKRRQLTAKGRQYAVEA
jgi:hypothetical protein